MREKMRGALALAGLSVLAAVTAILLANSRAEGGVISGTGAAEVVSGGPYDGWYRYTYTVTWDVGKGLSHWDLLLKTGCLQPDHEFAFDTDIGNAYDGLSTDDSWKSGNPITMPVTYDGAFEPRGDPSLNITQPLVKWEPGGGQPGKEGVGMFWFYSNVIPEYGVIEDVVAGKYGTSMVLGNLAGAYPSCNVVVPEPGTAAFLAMGAAAIVIRARRRSRGRVPPREVAL